MRLEVRTACRAVLVLGALWMGLSLGGTATAGSILWQIQSFYRHKVDLAFYSQNRRHEWPGGGNVYILNDYSVRKIRIACVNGERVCYGAWVRGNTRSYWGSGYKSAHRCQTCCYTCQNNVVTQVFKLNE